MVSRSLNLRPWQGSVIGQAQGTTDCLRASDRSFGMEDLQERLLGGVSIIIILCKRERGTTYDVDSCSKM